MIALWLLAAIPVKDLRVEADISPAISRVRVEATSDAANELVLPAGQWRFPSLQSDGKISPWHLLGPTPMPLQPASMQATLRPGKWTLTFYQLGHDGEIGFSLPELARAPSRQLQVRFHDAIVASDNRDAWRSGSEPTLTVTARAQAAAGDLAWLDPSMRGFARLLNLGDEVSVEALREVLAGDDSTLQLTLLRDDLVAIEPNLQSCLPRPRQVEGAREPGLLLPRARYEALTPALLADCTHASRNRLLYIAAMALVLLVMLVAARR